jgi:hypothetical protein
MGGKGKGEGQLTGTKENKKGRKKREKGLKMEAKHLHL